MRSNPPICTVFYKHYNSHLLVWLTGCLQFSTGKAFSVLEWQRVAGAARGRWWQQEDHCSWGNCLDVACSWACSILPEPGMGCPHHPCWDVSLAWAALLLNCSGHIYGLCPMGWSCHQRDALTKGLNAVPDHISRISKSRWDVLLDLNFTPDNPSILCRSWHLQTKNDAVKWERLSQDLQTQIKSPLNFLLASFTPTVSRSWFIIFSCAHMIADKTAKWSKCYNSTQHEFIQEFTSIL